MSETREQQPAVQIKDRRRFDMEGNLRSEAEVADTSGQAAHEDTFEAPPEQAQVPAHDEANDGEIARLQQELEATRKRFDELARAYQALERDREDFKARLTRERERMIDVERGKVALSLVEAIDELDLCLDASGQEASSPLAQGVALIRDKLLKKLETDGVVRMNLEGQLFDPALAEAVDMELTGQEQDDQKVVRVVRAGYQLNDRVIRPARVKVAKYVKPADA